MEKLAEVRRELLDVVSKIPQENVAKKPDEESWSVLEVLEHVSLVENMHIDAIAKALEEGSESNNIETKPVEQTLDRSQKIKTPPFLEPQGNYASLEAANEGLTSTRKKLVDMINSTKREILSTRSLEHPVYGEMSLQQWIEFVRAHEQRHIGQIKEIIG